MALYISVSKGNNPTRMIWLLYTIKRMPEYTIHTGRVRNKLGTTSRDKFCLQTQVMVSLLFKWTKWSRMRISHLWRIMWGRRWHILPLKLCGAAPLLNQGLQREKILNHHAHFLQIWWCRQPKPWLFKLQLKKWGKMELISVSFSLQITWRYSHRTCQRLTRTPNQTQDTITPNWKWFKVDRSRRPRPTQALRSRSIERILRSVCRRCQLSPIS